VAFFFAALFFAIAESPPRVFRLCGEIAFARRDTGGGRVLGGRGGTVARRPSVARGLGLVTSSQRAIAPNEVAGCDLSDCGNERRNLSRHQVINARAVDRVVENVSNRQLTWRLRRRELLSDYRRKGWKEVSRSLQVSRDLTTDAFLDAKSSQFLDESLA